MDIRAKKSSRVGKVLKHLNLNQELDHLFPTLFPSTVLSLVNLMRDSIILTGLRFPREQFIKDQFQLVIYDLVRQVRKKDVMAVSILGYLENLVALFEKIYERDLDASAYFIKYFYRLTIALNPLITYLERAEGQGVTDWNVLGQRMATALGKRQKGRKDVKVFPKLSKFVLGPTLSVQEGTVLRKAAFGATECVLRFTPFRAENARCRSFVAEKEAAAILTSVLFPQVYACFNTEGFHVYVTEYVEAVSSYRVLVQAKYFDDRILRVVLGQVGLALNYLHCHGIIHRDLYMPNILMMLGCRVKLIGLQHSKICMGRFSKNFFADKLIEFELGDEVLESNRYYMAPELLAGKHYGRGVDWWSLGITCFHLASGRQPFSHIAEHELTKIAECAHIEWPRFRNPSWQLQKFVTKCLQPVDTRMNFDEFSKHSFFEGINWNGLLNHEVFEPFPELHLAFSHGKDDAATSPSPSPSAEKDPMNSVAASTGCCGCTDKMKAYADVKMKAANVFTYSSEKYIAFMRAERGLDEENESNQSGVSPPSKFTFTLEKVKNTPLEIVITIFRRKLLCCWESWGFEVEEHTNHQEETLITVSHIEPYGCAYCGGLMNGDVILEVGSSSFWRKRSLRKEDFDDLLRGALDELNLKVAVSSTKRILQERADSWQVIEAAPRHTVVLTTSRENTSGPEDFGLKLQSFALPKAFYVLVDRLTDKAAIVHESHQFGLLNGDVVTSINGARVPSSMEHVLGAFKGWTTGTSLKIKAVAASALRPEISWLLWDKRSTEESAP